MLKSAERRPVAKALAYLRGNGKGQYGDSGYTRTTTIVVVGLTAAVVRGITLWRK
jgi:hypothetical protein